MRLYRKGKSGKAGGKILIIPKRKNEKIFDKNKNFENNDRNQLGMKHLLSILLAVTGYSGFSEAQITDDESSKNFLAIHCAVSGGRSAHDFEEYGRKLAKTIGLLSPSQQKNVFGYIPQPADTPVIPDYNPEFHGNLGSFGEASQSRGSAPGAASPAPANSPSGNSLVNAVGSFNSTL